MVKTLSKIGLIAGAVLVVLVIVLALCANILSLYSPMSQNISERLTPPSQQHPFGTDYMGRDNQARVFYGLRATLGVSALAVLIALVIGGVLGLIGGACGSAINRVVILFARFLSAGPGILLLLAIAYRWGSSVLHMALGMPIVLMPGFIRVFSGLIFCVKGNGAKKALGMVAAQIFLSMAMAALICAALGWMGFGIPVPTPELGSIIAGGIAYLRNAPFLIVYPSLALVVTALSFFILGESLNALVLVGESGGNNTELQEPSPQQLHNNLIRPE